HETVRYWMHNNMITIDGKKMGKSYGNFITLQQFFAGDHPLLDQAYSPMTIRFFILMAQYRSTLDFSNDALKGAEKAMKRMLEGWKRLQELKPSDASTIDVSGYAGKMREAMDDDLNTPIVLAHLFDVCRLINQVNDGNATATSADIATMKELFQTYLFDILGIIPEGEAGANMRPYEEAVDLLLQIRSEAKARKDWATSDLIRNRLSEIGFSVKDTKDGFEWSLK
ncbi:MAG: cysteine--tRNA ligase, partial [Muribaculaceae bacterium]|nr:cysteine--tRNA ligase [Muribaculaceae bacterium]